MLIKEIINIGIIRWLLIASFFAPLVVVDYFYFPFIVPKTIFFQVLIELALFFYIVLAVSNRRYLPKMDMITRAVLVFFGIYVLAALFGENVFRSFFGVFERMLGVFNLAHFVLMFLILKAVFLEKKDWVLFFRSFVLAGSLVGLYGFGQKMGLDIYNSGVSRIDSTIGNSAFFAAYMIFNVFFSIFLMSVDNRWRFSFLYKVTFFMALLSVYLSETRGAILGISLAFMFLLYNVIRRYGSKLKYVDWDHFFDFRRNGNLKWILGLFAVLAVLVVTNASVFMGPIKRIASISFEDATTKTRILSAGVSWHGFLEHPILGWGPENYNLLFDKYYDPRLYPTESWFDHAHNIIFDTLSNAGILGLVSYILVFAASVYILLIYGKIDEKSFFVSRLFVALLIAYVFQNMFVFDALATYLPFFLVLAFIGFLSEDEKKDKRPRSVWVPVLASIPALALILCSIYFLNVRPAFASYYTVTALAVNPVHPDTASKRFDKAFEYALMGKPEIATRMVDYSGYISRVKNMPEEMKRRFFDKAIKKMEEAIEEEPKNSRYHMYFANMASSNANNRDLLYKLDNVMQEATEMSPKKPIIYLQHYQIKLLLGKNEEAIDLLKKSLEFHYDFRISMVLALNYRELSMFGDAVNHYENLLKRQDLSPKERLSIAVELATMGENGRAIGVVQDMIAKDASFQRDGFKFIQDVQNGKFEGDINNLR